MSNLSKTIAILGVVAGLGVAALPLSSYAAQPEPTDPAKVIDGDANDKNAETGKVATDTSINLLIEDVLSIDTSADVVLLNKANSYTGTALTVNVATNNSKGYTLNIAGTADTNPTDLTSTTVSADKIVAVDKGIADVASAGALTLAADGSSVWGYSLDGTNYIGVKSGAGETIKTKDSATADAGEDTSVTFSAKLKDGQPAGTYEGKVTFTAANVAND